MLQESGPTQPSPSLALRKLWAWGFGSQNKKEVVGMSGEQEVKRHSPDPQTIFN